MMSARIVDPTPQEWAPEQAEKHRAAVHRAVWRQTGLGLFGFVVGWGGLVLMLVIADALSARTVLGVAVACLCLVVAGQVTLKPRPALDLPHLWVIGVAGGAGVVIGLLIEGSAPALAIGMWIYGVVSVDAVVSFVQSYRRLLPS